MIHGQLMPNKIANKLNCKSQPNVKDWPWQQQQQKNGSKQSSILNVLEIGVANVLLEQKHSTQLLYLKDTLIFNQHFRHWYLSISTICKILTL